MENVILIFLLAAVLGGAVAYIVTAKKRGVKCIGCSVGGTCGAKKGNGSIGGCGSCGGCTSCECGGESEQSECGFHTETK